MRKKIGLHMSMEEIVFEMSEGAPGAIDVLVRILEKNPFEAIGIILGLDDMNIRGSQIWVAYKDASNSDLDLLKKNVIERSKEMVSCVNRECDGEELAVIHGASFNR